MMGWIVDPVTREPLPAVDGSDPKMYPNGPRRLLRAIAQSADPDGFDADPDLISEARRLLSSKKVGPEELRAYIAQRESGVGE